MDRTGNWCWVGLGESSLCLALSNPIVQNVVGRSTQSGEDAREARKKKSTFSSLKWKCCPVETELNVVLWPGFLNSTFRPQLVPLKGSWLAKSSHVIFHTWKQSSCLAGSLFKWKTFICRNTKVNRKPFNPVGLFFEAFLWLPRNSTRAPKHFFFLLSLHTLSLFSIEWFLF